MKKKVDPLGSVLLKQGILDREQLTDVLDLQAQPMPFASVCYMLGHATEDQLVRALSGQNGAPGVVLGRSIVNLEVLDGISKETASQKMVLPVFEDPHHIFLAVHDLSTRELFNEIQFIKGKNVLPHVALHITLARAIRLCYAARAEGLKYWFGEKTTAEDLVSPGGVLSAVSDVDDLPEDVLSPGPEHSAEDFSGEVVPLELDDIIEVRPGDSEGGHTVPDSMITPTPTVVDQAPRRRRSKVLVADADASARSALSRVLRSGNYEVIEAADGQAAARTIRAELPDVTVLQVMLPGIPGFRLCQELKESGRYENILCILVGGTAAHAGNADTIRERYKSDAFLPRNVGPGSTLARIEELRGADSPKKIDWVEPAAGPSLKRALELYRDKQLEKAVEAARMCVTWDPFSPRYRFVLANLLHGQDKPYEALDAYQATVDLVPDWFPALTRLAYLQYQKGFVSRAITTWKKAVDVCPDPNVARNITAFISRVNKLMEERRR